MSFFTWRWLLPQKLQRSCSLPSVARAIFGFYLCFSDSSTAGGATRGGLGGGPRVLRVDDLVAEIDALVADVDARPGDELLHLALALTAETAEELLVAVGCAGHFRVLPLFLGFVYGGVTDAR